MALIDTGKSKFWVIENFSPDYYDELVTLPLLNEPPINIMGRECKMRRDVGFFSDESVGYKFSGQIAKSSPLNTNPILNSMLSKVNKFLGTNFNGILVNRYIDGTKYISAHSDDEKGLDKNKKMVAGISYGPAERIFRIREKLTNKIVLDYIHKPLTLVVMEGEFQKEFTHEIPQQKRVKEDRISLTFRHHIE